MREQLRDLLPPLPGLDPFELEGVGDRLTGHSPLQGQASGMQGGLYAWRADLLRPDLQIMSKGEERSKNRGDERGMQERLQGAGPLGVNLVGAVHRLVQPDAECDLPAHAVEVSDLPWVNPRRRIRQEETVSLGGLDADKTEMQRVLVPAHMHIGVNGAAVEDQCFVS